MQRMSGAEKGRSSYLDLLVAALMEHEKDLDRLVEKLEKASSKLSAMRKEAGLKGSDKTVKKEKGKETVPESGALIYMKIKLDRPTDEVTKIIESLKE